MRFRLRSFGTASLSIAVTVIAAGCSSGGTASTGPSPTTSGSVNVSQPKAGGSITVLEGKGYSGDWPYGFDPATNVDAIPNQDMMEAIYGQLFMLGPGGKIEPDLATGYSFSPDAKTVTITLRQGVKFSDGTPFNAQAVLYNWNRDFGPLAVKAGISPTWPVARTNPKDPTSTPVKGAYAATGPYTLVIHQAIPNAAFINQLFDTIPTWIGSPAAVQKMGELAFAKNPVGAGPFVVESDTYSNQVVVKRNPTYWQAGRPYLDQITFKTVGTDETALETMLAGGAQVYGGLGETALINEAEQHFQVLDQPGTSPYDLQLNTAIPPFNNPKAREAIYAATDFSPILAHIFGNRYPVVEGFTGPGGICYQQHVPGYQGYNPTLAKQLVQQSGLDKVTINLGTISSSQVAVETTQALETEWAAVGIKATLQSYVLNSLIQAFEKNSGKWWQSMVQTAGAFDPAGGIGVSFRFSSASPFSGVHDPHLDTLLNQAQGSTSLPTRCNYYHQAQEYIAKNFYGPFYFSLDPTNVSAKGIGGPGLTSAVPAVAVTPTIPWESVWYNPPS
ncbi:MAG: glutathione transport system substrate-binding protein [Trebonia sp.]|jgi:peptide/nickel transport system substrate-binding protein|nr:peptide transporter substrate-binding protein [Actinomycetes bacterium]MDX6421844.1 glutathione transport system substrate-binding protein [Trebonia sp.]